MAISLYVFFEEPFWAGLFIETDGDITRYCRVVFGQEPTDGQVYEFLLHEFNDLKFTDTDSPVVRADDDVSRLNPKRRQRQASRILKERIGTSRSYELIKQSLISDKNRNNRKNRRSISEQQKITARELRNRKKKEKHRGR